MQPSTSLTQGTQGPVGVKQCGQVWVQHMFWNVNRQKTLRSGPAAEVQLVAVPCRVRSRAGKLPSCTAAKRKHESSQALCMVRCQAHTWAAEHSGVWGTASSGINNKQRACRKFKYITSIITPRPSNCLGALQRTSSCQHTSLPETLSFTLPGTCRLLQPSKGAE